MFIEVVRRHLDALPPEQTGWLAGLSDPFIGKALSLLHGWPVQNWTIEELAKQVGVSRSLLAERFADLVGIPPLQYLARWRMQICVSELSLEWLNVRFGSLAVVATTPRVGWLRAKNSHGVHGFTSTLLDLGVP
jgi:hypothetical protein